MPTVPKKQIGEIRNAPAPTVFQTSRGIEGLASVGQGLTALGSGFQNLSDTTEKIALKVAVEDNERRAKELDVDFNKRRRAILYGDEENPGYYGRKGSEAVDSFGGVQDQLKKAREEVSGLAKNERIKRIFDKSSLTKTDSDLETMSAFVTRERVSANLIASQARTQEAIEDSTLAYNDKNVIDRSTAIVRSEVFAQSKIQGWKPETIKTELGKALTVMYTNMIKGALNRQDVQGAVDILDKYRGQMDAPVAAEMEALISKPKLIAQAQTEVEKILALSVTREEKLKAARALHTDNPTLRDEISKRLNARFNEEDTLQTDARKEKAREWNQSIVGGGQSLDTLIIRDPEAWALISQDFYLARALEASEVLRTKRETYARVDDSKLVEKLSIMSTQELAGVRPEDYRALLTEQTFKSFAAKVGAAKNKLEASETNRERYTRYEQMLKQMAPKNMEVFQKDQSQKNKDITNKIIQEMDVFVSERLKTGKEPTDPELRAQVQRLLTPVSQGGMLEPVFDFLGVRNKTAAEALTTWTPRELSNLRVDFVDIPPEQVRQIGEIFKKRDITPTNDLIEQYMGATVINDRARKERLLGIGKPTSLRNLNVEKPIVKKETPVSSANPISEPIASVANKEETVVAETPLPAKKETLAGTDATPVNREKFHVITLLVESGNQDKPEDSEEGAVGPGQILPKWFTKDFGKNLANDPVFKHIKPATEVQLRDPEFSRNMSRQISFALLDKYDDDFEKAAAAYHTGWPTVDRAIKQHGENWFKFIGPKTRAYVDKIATVFLKSK